MQKDPWTWRYRPPGAVDPSLLTDAEPEAPAPEPEAPAPEPEAPAPEPEAPAPEPEAPAWESAGTHAALADTMPAVETPDGWSDMTLTEKKDWLRANV